MPGERISAIVNLLPSGKHMCQRRALLPAGDKYLPGVGHSNKSRLGTCELQRVDELLLQCAHCHVRPLGHIEDLVGQAIAPAGPRLQDAALCEGPEAAQDTKET